MAARRRPDIGFVPTPADAATAMLKLAELSAADIVYDLGCGDGHLLIEAAVNYGVRGVGIDVDSDLLDKARAGASWARVDHRLTFTQSNLFEANFQAATVVLIYLLPRLNLRLRSRLQTQLRPGSRIVSHMFDMGDWEPHLTLRLEESEEDSVIYLWRIPK
ncbi:MAG: methyltransferase domain-containing protein [Nodosilinea sp.]